MSLLSVSKHASEKFSLPCKQRPVRLGKFRLKKGARVLSNSSHLLFLAPSGAQNAVNNAYAQGWPSRPPVQRVA